MTEEEAKTKRCPLLFAPLIVAAPRDIGVGYQGKCIASACMMWRPIMGHGTEFEPPKQLGGYCGLAGKP